MKPIKYFLSYLSLFITTAAFANSSDTCFNSCEQADCELGVNIYGDWLYWNTRACSLEYALPDGTSDDIIGTTKRVSPDWASGFRVGLQKQSCDNFVYGVRYTYYSNNSTSTTIDDVDGDLGAILVSPEKQFTSNRNIEFASGKYDVSLNVIDLEAGYKQEMCGSGSLSLFGGVKLAYIDQNFKTQYSEDNADRQGTESGNAVDIVQQKVDMNAYGLYFGFDSTVDLFCNLSLFARSSIGALVGQSNMQYKHEGQSGGNEFEVDIDLKDCCNRIVSVIDMSAGLQYSLCSYCNSNWIFKIGYDFNHWFNTSGFIMVNENNNGNQQWLDRYADSLGFDGPFIGIEGKF